MELFLAAAAVVAAVVVPILLWYFSPESLRRRLRRKTDDGASEPAKDDSPLSGWQFITPRFLASQPPLSSGGLVRFFDGAAPGWSHAVSSRIPRRDAVGVVVQRLCEVHSGSSETTLQLVRAAGGEGKSTLLLQAAVDLARGAGWAVLWRDAPFRSLDSEQLALLDSSRHWLLVADDGESLIGDLVTAARWLHERSMVHVHFLIAARDTDWIAAKGEQQGWEQWLVRHADIVLHGVSHEDAESIVRAWDAAGAEGLGLLADERDLDARVRLFEAAVTDQIQLNVEARRSGRPEDGSFFGGLLEARLGSSGLRAHVRSLLQRLEAVGIDGSTCTLADALVYAAACHNLGTSGVDVRVLADLMGVDRKHLWRYVVRPLGDEAAATFSAGRVITRHSRVAEAVLLEAETGLLLDLAELWTQLVCQTVETGRHLVLGPPYGELVHAGPRLLRTLPEDLGDQRRADIAIAAASAACKYLDDRLSCVVDLGKTYRAAGKYQAARDVFLEHLPESSKKADFNAVIRGYYHEWSVCEALLTDDDARLRSAWLEGLSLEDHLATAPITERDVALVCAGLGVTFGWLAAGEPTGPFALGRRGCSFLGRLAHPNRKTLGYFDKYDRDADSAGTPKTQDLNDAISWLAQGVQAAGRRLSDPQLSSLASPEQLSFSRLRRVIGPTSRRRSRVG